MTVVTAVPMPNMAENAYSQLRRDGLSIAMRPLMQISSVDSSQSFLWLVHTCEQSAPTQGEDQQQSVPLCLPHKVSCG